MNPNNSDELIRIITALLSDLMGEAGLSPEGRFTGYAIFAGKGGTPTVIRLSPEDRHAPSWEVTEGEGKVYITALLPPGTATLPSVTFQPLFIGITAGEETFVVNLPCRVDLDACSWQVKNGVLDIACRKA